MLSFSTELPEENLGERERAKRCTTKVASQKPARQEHTHIQEEQEGFLQN